MLAADHPLYRDDVLTGLVTREFVSNHGPLLQLFKGGDPAAHVAWLLDVYDIPPYARVTDVGCGVGGVADLMKKQRPDLRMTLLNQSAAQLAMCPDIGTKVHGDMHNLPPATDVVMVNYTLGHSDIAAFANACAFTAADSVCIYDLVPRDCDVDDLTARMAYRFHTECEIMHAFVAAGFHLARAEYPPYTADWARKVFNVDLQRLRPVAYVFMRDGIERA